MDWAQIGWFLLKVVCVAVPLVTIGAHPKVTPVFRPLAELTENLIVVCCGWAVRSIDRNCRRLYAWSQRARAEKGGKKLRRATVSDPHAETTELTRDDLLGERPVLEPLEEAPPATGQVAEEPK